MSHKEPVRSKKYIKYVVLVVALLVGVTLAACNSGGNKSSPQLDWNQSQSTVQPYDYDKLRADALTLADKAGCPNPSDLATNGAPGAFPGAPKIGFTCTNKSITAGSWSSSIHISVFGSSEDKQANLDYTTSNVGGSGYVVGDNFIAQVYDDKTYQAWASVLGGTVR
jgi:hypothetical protein